jgi:hypothetical protein
MPKENTHLWFAQDVADRLDDQEERSLVLDHLDAYRLGAVSPDLFFYARGDRLRPVADYLHAGGDGPNPDFVLDCLDGPGGLDRPGPTDPGPDLAFVLGYLTHCSLDATFHPVINAVARDMGGPLLANHFLVETALDREFNRGFFLDELVEPGLVRRLRPLAILAERFGIGLEDIRAVLVRMRRANRAFRSRAGHAAAVWLCRLGASGLCGLLPLFYASLRKGWPGGHRVDFACIRTRDPDTGEERTTSAGELFGLAHERAAELLAWAWDCHRNRIARQECWSALAGLEQGRDEARPARLARAMF